MTFKYVLYGGFSNRDPFSKWIYQSVYDNYCQMTGQEDYRGNSEDSENTMRAWIEKTHGCKFVRPKRSSMLDHLDQDYLIFDSYEDYLLLRLKC